MISTAAPDLFRSARVFHALSDETRLAIIDRLKGGERCVCDLQDLLDAAQSRLSFHLKTLKDAGLVADRKEGRWSYYTLVPGVLEQAVGALVEVKESAERSGGSSCCA
jgi:ArsR family transcriptional regulator, arsenate/arsenite/antimonite-responsive transcriptional repressor